jgi:hypothetical protein
MQIEKKVKISITAAEVKKMLCEAGIVPDEYYIQKWHIADNQLAGVLHIELEHLPAEIRVDQVSSG